MSFEFDIDLKSTEFAKSAMRKEICEEQQQRTNEHAPRGEKIEKVRLVVTERGDFASIFRPPSFLPPFPFPSLRLSRLALLPRVGATNGRTLPIMIRHGAIFAGGGTRN